MGKGKTGKLSGRVWGALILFGLFGQLAWMVENNYFNLYLYNTVSTNPYYTSGMVAASAVVAAITTILMGNLSDKRGKRKFFICGGYIIWGITTAAFAFLTVENTQKWFPAANAVVLTAILIVIMDCIMTFFGSTANDAAFNAWVTDVTNKRNRGKAESVLSIMPLLAMIIIFGGFSRFTDNGEWATFYFIIGGLVTLGGFIGMFILKDSPDLEPSQEPLARNVIYGFKPSTVKTHPRLYLTFVILAMVNMAYQVYSPYLIIYLNAYLKLDDYALVLMIVLLFAAVASVIAGRFLDKIPRQKFLIPMLVIMSAVELFAFFARTQWTFTVAAMLMIASFLILLATVGSMIRDETPSDKVGLFQGVRIIFYTMIPMVTGPYIGAALISNSSQTYVEMGVTRHVPTPSMYLGAAVVSLLAVLPVVVLLRMQKRDAAEPEDV